MEWIANVNIILALVSMAFGAIGFLWPDFALGALKLETTAGRADGKSEIRAASGGAFIAMALAGLALGPTHPVAWVMVGAHYTGAAVGRLLSIVADRAGSRRMWLFFAVEAMFAAWFVSANSVG